MGRCHFLSLSVAEDKLPENVNPSCPSKHPSPGCGGPSPAPAGPSGHQGPSLVWHGGKTRIAVPLPAPWQGSQDHLPVLF